MEALERVKQQILAEPSQFYMHNYFENMATLRRSPVKCGTAACIGGFLIANDEDANPEEASRKWYGKFGYEFRSQVANILDVTLSQVDRLVLLKQWPPDLTEAYEEAERHQDWSRAALIACKRIDQWVASKGAE